MKTKKTKINEFMATLEDSSEMTDKQFVSLSGSGLRSVIDEKEKNKHNSGCCNDNGVQ